MGKLLDMPYSLTGEGTKKSKSPILETEIGSIKKTQQRKSQNWKASLMKSILF